MNAYMTNCSRPEATELPLVSEQNAVTEMLQPVYLTKYMNATHSEVFDKKFTNLNEIVSYIKQNEGNITEAMNINLGTKFSKIYFDLDRFYSSEDKDYDLLKKYLLSRVKIFFGIDANNNYEFYKRIKKDGSVSIHIIISGYYCNYSDLQSFIYLIKHDKENDIFKIDSTIYRDISFFRTLISHKLFTENDKSNDYNSKFIDINLNDNEEIKSIIKKTFVSVVTSEDKFVQLKLQNIKKTDISHEEVSEKIILSLKNKTPLSILRFGGRELILAKHKFASKDQKNHCVMELGREITEQEYQISKENLINSILNADILGVPQDYHLRSVNPHWKIIGDFYSEVESENKSKYKNKRYCSNDLHFDLIKSKQIFKILSTIKKVVIVSCRNICKELIDIYKNIQTIEYYKIPGEQIYELEINKNYEINFFERIEEVVKELKSKDRSGELLIFGTGPFGKHLGYEFSSVGGVSLDFGSGFDVQHWYRSFERLEDCMQNKIHLLQFGSPINLFTSYFISPDQSRQQEIDRCLSININNPNIKRIFLFLDCGVSIANIIKNFGHKKLNFIHLNRRPTYEDWIVWSKTLDQQISVFANSDIFFDHTIKKLELYLKNEKSIVCISRHNFQNNNWILQDQPEWSQDVWAIKYSDINFSDQLNIKIGFPACDNRMACVFAMNGWNIFNPCSEIKCFHFHRSEHRDYKKYDPNSAGFLALVPESNLDKPSEVTIVASPIKMENIKEVRLSNFLEKGLSNAT